MKKRSFGMGILALGLVFGPPAIRAQEANRPVKPEDLLNSPQRYWARNMVFADILRSHPSGGPIRLDSRRGVAFSTEGVGRCYADPDVAAVLSKLPLDRPYHFLGTVLQHRGRFVVVVRGVTAALQEDELALGWSAIAESPEDDLYARALRPLRDILTDAEGAYVLYADDKGIQMEELFDPESPHFAVGLNMMRAVIGAYGQRVRTTGDEILAQYLYQILGSRRRAEKARAPVSPVSESGPAATTLAVEPAPPVASTKDTALPAVERLPPAVVPAVGKPPRRLTKKERREEALRQKAEARSRRLSTKTEPSEPALETPPAELSVEQSSGSLDEANLP